MLSVHMIAGDPQRDGWSDQEVRAERIEKGNQMQTWVQKQAGGFSHEASFEKLREAEGKGKKWTPSQAPSQRVAATQHQAAQQWAHHQSTAQQRAHHQEAQPWQWAPQQWTQQWDQEAQQCVWARRPQEEQDSRWPRAPAHDPPPSTRGLARWQR